MFNLITFLSLMTIATATGPPLYSNLDNSIVDTKRWGAVKASSLERFHSAYDSYAKKQFDSAASDFQMLIKDLNHHLADEAKWYFAECLLLMDIQLHTAFEIYLSLAVDKNSVWAPPARDKLMLPQFRKFLTAS